MLADARLPTGAHTQSSGLEPAALGGLRPSEIPGYAAARLRTGTLIEAATAVSARHAWLAASRGAVNNVVDEWAARTPSKPARDAASHAGRGYARLALRLWPRELAPNESTMRGCRPDLRYPRAVVVGIVAAVTGVAAADLARVIAYDAVQTIASAALKLYPLDPLEAAAWLPLLAPEIEVLVHAASVVIEPAEIPAPSAPRLDHLVSVHSRATRRLFHA